jgi:hypothetical protein
MELLRVCVCVEDHRENNNNNNNNKCFSSLFEHACAERTRTKNMLKRQLDAMVPPLAAKRLKVGPLHEDKTRCETFKDALVALNMPAAVARLVSEFEQEVHTHTHTHTHAKMPAPLHNPVT